MADGDTPYGLNRSRGADDRYEARVRRAVRHEACQGVWVNGMRRHRDSPLATRTGINTLFRVVV
jgi:hypothetical protein